MADEYDVGGNGAQIRAIAKSLVEAANFEMAGNMRPKTEIPAPLKWGAAIFAAMITVGATGLLFWMVSTISATQITVVRIDERQAMTSVQWDAKFKGLEDRMIVIEAQSRLNAEDRGRRVQP